MSYTDIKFKELCNEILTNGYSSEGQKIRAKWADGTPAHTKKNICRGNSL